LLERQLSLILGPVDDLEHHSSLEHFGFEISGAHLSDRVKHGTHHKLSVDFTNMPKGTRTAYSGQPGLFKEVKLNRGRAMGLQVRMPNGRFHLWHRCMRSASVCRCRSRVRRWCAAVFSPPFSR
jgi:hypothetical protein